MAIKTGKKSGIRETVENVGAQFITLEDFVEKYDGRANIFDFLEGFNSEDEEYYYIFLGIVESNGKAEKIASYIPSLLRNDVAEYYGDTEDMEEIRSGKYDLIVEKKERKEKKRKFNDFYYTGYFEEHNFEE